MEKLDLKDRKILYHLDQDSRQSFSQVGKKVGLHKDVVAYRVNNLLEKGIIRFIACINEYKLGISYLRFCLTYQYVTPEIKKEIIEYFVNNKYTVAIHAAEGHYNLVILVAVKNTPVFYNAWCKIFGKYRDYFANQVFSIFCETIEYKYSFLLDDGEPKKEDRVLFKRYDDGKVTKIDELDHQILKLLHYNARMPTIEIAKNLNSTAVTINNRISKMEKSGVILGFRTLIDYSKIGYQYYKVDIVLKDPKKSEKIVEYVENNPNLVGRIVSLGYVDLEFVFFLQSANQLHELMNDLSSKFPDVIKSYIHFTITNTHKYQYLPEE
jgi:Lrp/AsnC family transcriptional regulator for asnA, asnC and gidA